MRIQGNSGGALSSLAAAACSQVKHSRKRKPAHHSIGTQVGFGSTLASRVGRGAGSRPATVWVSYVARGKARGRVQVTRSGNRCT